MLCVRHNVKIIIHSNKYIEVKKRVEKEEKKVKKEQKKEYFRANVVAAIRVEIEIRLALHAAGMGSITTAH